MHTIPNAFLVNKIPHRKKTLLMSILGIKNIKEEKEFLLPSATKSETREDDMY